MSKQEHEYVSDAGEELLNMSVELTFLSSAAGELTHDDVHAGLYHCLMNVSRRIERIGNELHALRCKSQ